MPAHPAMRLKTATIVTSHVFGAMIHWNESHQRHYLSDWMLHYSRNRAQSTKQLLLYRLVIDMDNLNGDTGHGMCHVLIAVIDDDET